MEHIPSDWEFDDVFDAMELGCGQLLLDFRMHIRPLPEGSVVMLATRDIASLDSIPAKDINDMRAEMVFADLVEAWKGRRPFEALALLGKLALRFPDAKILGDAELQKAKFGVTSAELLRKAVHECEGMCGV